jgi:phage tail sheath protein FI
MITLASDEDEKIDYDHVIKEKETELNDIEQRLTTAKQMMSRLEGIWGSRTHTLAFALTNYSKCRRATCIINQLGTKTNRKQVC